YKVKDWFRKFSSPEESFMYQADFFSKLSRYAKAMAVKHNPYKFAEEIAKAGYATAPDYAYTLQLIMKIIDPSLPNPTKKK
ncbi:glucosaminidase domain-containing protein, partial [Capnocytophaga felis]